MIYSIKLNLLGLELILSTTWLVKNLEEPVLKFHFFLDPKCLSNDFSINDLAFAKFGQFQSTINSVSNFLKLQFLWGCVWSSATLPMHSMTDSFGVLQNIFKARERNFSLPRYNFSSLQIPWKILMEENYSTWSPNWLNSPLWISRFKILRWHKTFFSIEYSFICLLFLFIS